MRAIYIRPIPAHTMFIMYWVGDTGEFSAQTIDQNHKKAIDGVPDLKLIGFCSYRYGITTDEELSEWASSVMGGAQDYAVITIHNPSPETDDYTEFLAFVRKVIQSKRFSFADLDGANFAGVNFAGANLAGANLTRAVYNTHPLSRTLRNANLPEQGDPIAFAIPTEYEELATRFPSDLDFCPQTHPEFFKDE